jgi:mRNA-degrading endonuclease toxin of MazEF toxin-antitoxin module
MAAFDIKKYDVFVVDLPVQEITKMGEDKRPFTVTGTEMNGDHRCIVVSVDPNGQYAVVVPLSSAQNATGAEKWHTWKKSWARLVHKGRYVAAQCEQLRYVDRARLLKNEGPLGEYDQKLIDVKLRDLLSLN